ncbi:peroxisomal membrane anchor protein conserved region-domain-containing protein [Phycomyces blakesleeanus]
MAGDTPENKDTPLDTSALSSLLPTQPPTSETTPTNTVATAAPIAPTVPTTPNTHVVSPPPTTPTMPTTAVTPSASPVQSSSPSEPPREDLIKSAVSFLSSPNVKTADNDKKIAFLKKKNLTQSEIDEAFRRAGDSGSTTISVSPRKSTPPTSSNMSSAPLIPARPSTYQQQPQVVYYPQPLPPTVPTEKVMAIAVVFGLIAVGATAGVVGIVKHFVQPIFNAIAAYQQKRCNQRKEILAKINKKLKDVKEANEEEEEDPLDALDDDKQRSIKVFVNEHKHLSEGLEQLVSQARLLVKSTKQTPYGDFRSSMNSFRSVLNDTQDNYSPSYASYGNPYSAKRNSESPGIQALKSEIRSLKGALLNRRNFPMVTGQQ